MTRTNPLKRLLLTAGLPGLVGLPGLIGLFGLWLGCTPPPVTGDDSDVNGDLHPRTLFDVRVQPELVSTCAPCHSVAQGTVQAFLTAGMEYDSITGYKSGIFLSDPAVQSLLLQKGQHTGPALTATQFADVQAWLEAEVATRASSIGEMKSALLPTVPLQAGDFNMSFSDIDPILDPEANLTFTLDEDDSRIFRVSKMKITTGSSTGIHFKHPIFYFISAKGSFADPADSLQAVDQQVDVSGSATVGSGLVLLTQAPENRLARIGLAFEVLERYNAAPPTDVKCKAFNLFNPAVTDQLKSCAATCHSPGKNNTANSAFNMSAVNSTDGATMQQFCVDALGRIYKEMPQDSIIIKQITPQNLGGTPNHPFKQTDDTARMKFINAVLAWVAGEK